MIWPFSRKPEGQLEDVERTYLFDLVRAQRPDIVVESGTWKGGGSTLFLVRALCENGQGHLHTWESHPPFHAEASAYYTRNPRMNRQITLHLGDFVQAAEAFEQAFLDRIGVVFLDGGDETPQGTLKLPRDRYPDASENVRSFKALADRLRPGTHVLLHDWGVEGGRGMFVRQVLERDGFGPWNITKVLKTGTGLCHMTKSGSGTIGTPAAAASGAHAGPSS